MCLCIYKGFPPGSFPTRIRTRLVAVGSDFSFPLSSIRMKRTPMEALGRGGQDCRNGSPPKQSGIDSCDAFHLRYFCAHPDDPTVCMGKTVPEPVDDRLHGLGGRLIRDRNLHMTAKAEFPWCRTFIAGLRLCVCRYDSRRDGEEL